jgi:hypothetical protein
VSFPSFDVLQLPPKDQPTIEWNTRPICRSRARCYTCIRRSRFEIQWDNWISFFNFLFLPSSGGPRVYSVSNRNEYQKEKISVWKLELGLRVRLTTSPQSVGRLSRQCGILNIWQPSKPLRPVTTVILITLCPCCLYSSLTLCFFPSFCNHCSYVLSFFLPVLVTETDASKTDTHMGRSSVRQAERRCVLNCEAECWHILRR